MAYGPGKTEGLNSWRVVGRISSPPTKRFLKNGEEVAADITVRTAMWGPIELRMVASKELGDVIPTIYSEGDLVSVSGMFGEKGKLVRLDMCIIEKGKGLERDPEGVYKDAFWLYHPDCIDSRIGHKEDEKIKEADK